MSLEVAQFDIKTVFNANFCRQSANVCNQGQSNLETEILQSHHSTQGGEISAYVRSNPEMPAEKKYKLLCRQRNNMRSMSQDTCKESSYLSKIFKRRNGESLCNIKQFKAQSQALSPLVPTSSFLVLPTCSQTPVHRKLDDGASSNAKVWKKSASFMHVFDSKHLSKTLCSLEKLDKKECEDAFQINSSFYTNRDNTVYFPKNHQDTHFTRTLNEGNKSLADINRESHSEKDFYREHVYHRTSIFLKTSFPSDKVNTLFLSGGVNCCTDSGCVSEMCQDNHPINLSPVSLANNAKISTCLENSGNVDVATEDEESEDDDGYVVDHQSNAASANNIEVKLNVKMLARIPVKML